MSGSEESQSPAPPPLAPPPVLTYDVARRYVPSGRAHVGGLVLVLGGGLGAAVVAASLAWIWLWAELPSFLILPVIMQGVLVGGALAYLFRRARLRNAPIAIGIGLLCGIFSAACFQGVSYVYNAYRLPHLVQLAMWQEGVPENSPQLQRTVAALRAAPLQSYDQYVIWPTTRRHGFVGFLMLHSALVWGFTGVQVLIVAGIAGYVGKRSASQPFCETCGVWYRAPFTATLLPAAYGQELARAIEADDPAKAAELARVGAEDVGYNMAIAEVYRCPKCRTQLAAVVLKLFANKGQNRTKVLPLHRVSDETVQALRSTRAVEVPEPEPSPPADPATES